MLGGLGARAHDHEVDVHVRGAGHGPGDRVRHVLVGERFGDARVDRRGLLGVAVEAVERELAGLHHARRDLDDPDRLAGQLEPQRGRDRVLRVLGGDIAAAALVGDEAGGGREHDDRARPARHQLGQQRLRHVQRAEHVDLVHGLPLRRGRVLHGVRADRPAGVADEYVAAVQRLGELVDLRAVGDVEVMRFGLAAAFGDPVRDRLEAVGPAGGQHHPIPGVGQLHRCGRSDPAACSGDDGCSLHAWDCASRVPATDTAP